jgi:hypothetical protein
MSIKKHLPIYLLSFLLLIYSCKKDFYSFDSASKSNSLNTDSIKQLFNQKNYDLKLKQTINDSIEIKWNVNWANYSQSVVNDTLTYYYFPLQPTSNNQTKLKNKSLQEVNFKKFIIVGKTQKNLFFKIATYYYDSRSDKKISSIGEKYSFSKFTGHVVYDNIDKNNITQQYMLNGNYVADPFKNTGIKTNSTIKTNDFDCYNQVVCYYSGSCDGGLVVTAIVARDFCPQPPTFWPTVCGVSFYGWNYSGSESKVVCDPEEYPYPPAPPSSGGGGGGIGGTVPDISHVDDPTKKPCPGDPVKISTIAPSSPININGGRFGNTRLRLDGTIRFHGGTDIYAEPNTPVYPIMNGVVVRIVNNIPEGTYVSSKSFGNLIEIQSYTTRGDHDNIRTETILYGHLNKVRSDLHVGSTVTVGTSMGLTGKTGNAARGVKPHVHIQVRDAGGSLINAEPYIRTKFSTTNATPTITPC